MHKLSYAIILFILLISTPCINAQHKDCNTALEFCDNSPFYIIPEGGTGIDDAGIENTCVFQEFSSMWIKWTVIESGTISFVLTPDSMMQDIDFVVFKDGSDYNCTDKTPIRCMAAGANSNQDPEDWINCVGPTGLAPGNTDVEEPAGCSSSSNNFLAPIQALTGEQYIMLINEFSGSGFGYTFNYTGTAELGCITATADPEVVLPQATFAVYPTVSTGTIFIHVAGISLPGSHLSIFNEGGQLVYSNDELIGTAFQVDLPPLPPGAYFAVLKTSNSTQTQRFLVTK